MNRYVPIPMYTPPKWTRPVARPKLMKEYAAYPLTEVAPLPPFIIKAKERYMKRKEDFITQRTLAKETVQRLQNELQEIIAPSKTYTVIRKEHKDKQIQYKTEELNKHDNILSSITQAFDTYLKESRDLEEVLSIQQKLEESYIQTKQLEIDSRKSWACLF